MTPINADSLRARGAELRQARAKRTRSIRRRVTAGAVALFMAGWLLIAVVLVSGHDPALASGKVATASTASGTTTTASGATGTTSSGATGSGTTASSTTGSTGTTTGSGTTGAATTTSSGTTGSSSASSGLVTRQS